MKKQLTRVKKESKLLSFAKDMHDYAYSETIAIIAVYLTIGYLIDSKDVCILGADISYLIILLSIITLYHGFQSGLLAMGMIAVAMWFFYPIFPYKEFLTALMMTLIFGQFHYYWTRRIYEAEVDSKYREAKLDELSKAFYTLKISHDQLEKNYVIKPMSLRNSIKNIKEKGTTSKEYYKGFLKLLDKAFNVNLASIIQKKEHTKNFETIANTQDLHNKIDINDPLIQDSINRVKPVYISEDVEKRSQYIAVIPALASNVIVGFLLIEKMPFMSFNKENLTSIAILFEYFFNEIDKENILQDNNSLLSVQDEEFKFEYFRLHKIYKDYGINSATFVFKIDDELLAKRLYDKTKNILRSLDMVTKVEQQHFTYIIFLFPFADESVCLGFMHRLLSSFKDIKEDDFEYMTFNFSTNKLLERYIGIDHES